MFPNRWLPISSSMCWPGVAGGVGSTVTVAPASVRAQPPSRATPRSTATARSGPPLRHALLRGRLDRSVSHGFLEFDPEVTTIVRGGRKRQMSLDGVLVDRELEEERLPRGVALLLLFGDRCLDVQGERQLRAHGSAATRARPEATRAKRRGGRASRTVHALASPGQHRNDGECRPCASHGGGTPRANQPRRPIKGDTCKPRARPLWP